MRNKKAHLANCTICGGRKEKGAITYSFDSGRNLLVVRKVPAMVCEQCGEEWIDNATAKSLEQLTNNARDKKHQFEVISY